MDFQNLPLFQLLGSIEENKRRVAGEQFTGTLASILSSSEPDEVKQSKLLAMLQPQQRKTGILETLGSILNRVNPNAPYEGNIAAESPILQQLIARRAGQVFRTPQEREKTELDMRIKRGELARSNLVTGQITNEIRPDIGNVLDNYMNELGINTPSVFNPPNQENGRQPVRSVNTKGITYYNQPKTLDPSVVEKTKEQANYYKAKTKQTESATKLAEENNIYRQGLWGSQIDLANIRTDEIDQQIEDKANPVIKATIFDAGNNVADVQFVKRSDWPDFTKDIISRGLKLGKQEIVKPQKPDKQTSKKDVWREYAKLTNRKEAVRAADGSTIIRYLAPTDAEIDSFNEMFADSGKRLVKKMTKPASVKKSVLGDTIKPAQYDYVLEDVGGAAGQGEPDNSPQSVEEFEQNVARLKTGDINAAKAYYDKWVGKWQ